MKFLDFYIIEYWFILRVWLSQYNTFSFVFDRHSFEVWFVLLVAVVDTLMHLLLSELISSFRNKQLSFGDPNWLMKLLFKYGNLSVNQDWSPQERQSCDLGGLIITYGLIWVIIGIDDPANSIYKILSHPLVSASSSYGPVNHSTWRPQYTRRYYKLSDISEWSCYFIIVLCQNLSALRSILVQMV